MSAISFVGFVKIFFFAVAMVPSRATAFLHDGLARPPHALNTVVAEWHGRGPRRRRGLLLDGGIFYDDFGENSEELNTKSEREDRMLQKQMDEAATKVKEGEIAYESKIARNWRRGNWSVRGFALDYASQIHVSAVAAPTSAAYTDATMAQDRALPDGRTVAVGRTG